MPVVIMAFSTLGSILILLFFKYRVSYTREITDID